MTAWIINHLALSLATGSVVVVTALLLMWRTRDPVVRHRILASFLPVLVLMPLVQIGTSELSPRRVAAASAPARLLHPRGGAGGEAVGAWDVGAAVGPGESIAVRGGVVRGRWTEPARRVGVAMYVIGAAALLFMIAARARRTSRLLLTCTDVCEARAVLLWNALARSRRVGTRTRLLESEHAPTPACCGVVRPSVVVPSREIAAADQERLSLILRHELVHIARLDIPAAVAQQLLRAVQWFNPLIWVYSGYLSRYRELSCDAIVVRETGKHQTYARTLLEYCRPRSRRGGVFALGLGAIGGGPAAGGSQSHLHRRLNMIWNEQERTDRPDCRRPLPRVVIVGIAAGALAACVGAALALGPGPLVFAQPVKEQAEKQPEKPAIEPVQTQPEKEKGPELKIELKDGALAVHGAGAAWKRATISVPMERRSVLSVLLMHPELARHVTPEGKIAPDVGFDGTITEQETLLSGDEVKVRENVLLGRDLTLNMPEGSRLRTLITAEAITQLKREQPLQLTARRGYLQLMDDTGVARVVLRAALDWDESAKRAAREKEGEGAHAKVKVEAAAPPEGTLDITITEDKGELVMRIKATKVDGTPTDVHATLDFKTGVPEGEKDPPPGAVRFRLFDADREEGKPLRVKMQWIHDLSKLGKEEEVRPPANTVK